jgi:hypothetical protein
MSDSMSQHCPNCEAQAAEIERLREAVQDAAETLARLHFIMSVEDVSINANVKGSIYILEEELRAALAGKAEQ